MAQAEPVKWADGTSKEATVLGFYPSAVELKTENGTKEVKLRDLHPEWIKSKYPEERAAALQSELLQLEEAIQHLKNGSGPTPQELVKKIEQLQFRAKSLEEENAKLKAQLKNAKRPSRK
jgi:predicted  nucleic acid-binding Zn-ribbon protein